MTPILIAHRGLQNGPDPTLENHPYQIVKSLQDGYDCEIDLWMINNELFLGHDEPQYKIDRSFLSNDRLWIHAKNLDALYWLSLSTEFNYFWHQNDDFVITSKHNYIWTYPGKTLTKNSICVMPEWNDPNFENQYDNCYGICSDYVNKIKSKYYRRS